LETGWCKAAIVLKIKVFDDLARGVIGRDGEGEKLEEQEGWMTGC